MGQYYQATSLDTLECVNTFDVGETMAELNKAKDKYDFISGMKLMEHSWLENEYVAFVMLLLSDEYKFGSKIGKGPWYKNSFGWIGDYADEPGEGPSSDQIKFALARMDNTEESKELIHLMSEKKDLGYWDVSEKYSKETILAILEKNKPLPKLRYIINDTKKLIIDLKQLELDVKELKLDEWIIHPLPLLTCVGNGRGGGDYRGDDDRIGEWFRDKIYTTNNISNLKVGKTGGYFFVDAYFTE